MIDEGLSLPNYIAAMIASSFVLVSQIVGVMRDTILGIVSNR